jgi:cystathionine beta-synthase
MKDGGYTDSPYNTTVGEMLYHTGKATKLIKMQDDKSIGNAIEIMDASSISQLPVFKGDSLVGYVSESRLATPLFDGTIGLEDNINLVMLSDYEIVQHDTPLQSIQDKLIDGKTIFVSDSEGNIVSIVTYTDLVNYIAGVK